MNTAVGKGSALWSASSLDDNTYVAIYNKLLCNLFKISHILPQNGNKQPNTLLNKRLSLYVSMECWLHSDIKPKVTIFVGDLLYQNYKEKAMKRNQMHEVDNIFISSDLFAHGSH